MPLLACCSSAGACRQGGSGGNGRATVTACKRVVQSSRHRSSGGRSRLAQLGCLRSSVAQATLGCHREGARTVRITLNHGHCPCSVCSAHLGHSGSLGLDLSHLRSKGVGCRGEGEGSGDRWAAGAAGSGHSRQHGAAGRQASGQRSWQASARTTQPSWQWAAQRSTAGRRPHLDGDLGVEILSRRSGGRSRRSGRDGAVGRCHHVGHRRLRHLLGRGVDLGGGGRGGGGLLCLLRVHGGHLDE